MEQCWPRAARTGVTLEVLAASAVLCPHFTAARVSAATQGQQERGDNSPNDTAACTPSQGTTAHKSQTPWSRAVQPGDNCIWRKLAEWPGKSGGGQ